MNHPTKKHKVAQIKKHKDALFDESGDISLNKILSSEACQTIISECREFRDRIYTPIKTIFMFVKQVLNPDKSCRNAVSGAVTEQICVGEEAASINTGQYCKARKRLPDETLHALVCETGNSSVSGAQNRLKWHGRSVKLVDGTTVTMSDTTANQQKFPQHGNQTEGAGFPIARLVAVMSLEVGTVIDYAFAAHKGKGTGEHSLFREIIDCIKWDDILLGDCYYPSFFLIADLQRRGADGIFHGQAQRHYDFRRGTSLGNKEHIVEWGKPVKPKWMNQEIYDSLPRKIKVREFKVNGKIYITTILDHKKHNKKEIAKLYKLRWQVEINLCSIKSVLNMDYLSCKTPGMVRKEIAAHMLGYNIIRIIMAEACSYHQAIPNKISFKGTVQLLNQFMPRFSSVKTSERVNTYRVLLSMIISNKVGNRPGRVEPRAVKRRRKPFPALNNKRKTEQDKILKKQKRRHQLDAACA
jgi:hypothetical protein